MARSYRTSTILPAAVLLVACTVGVVSQHQIDVTRTMWLNLTCIIRPALGWESLYSLRLYYITESGFHRPLANVSRSDIYGGSVLGDVPALSTHSGHLNESNHATSYLTVAFPFNKYLIGNYSCVTSYKAHTETGTKQQWVTVSIDGISNQQKSGFTADLTPAHRVTVTLPVAKRQADNIADVDRYLSANKDKKQRLATCTLDKDEPSCTVYAGVLAYNISYVQVKEIFRLDLVVTEDTNYQCADYVIILDSSESRSSSCPTHSEGDCNCTHSNASLSSSCPTHSEGDSCWRGIAVAAVVVLGVLCLVSIIIHGICFRVLYKKKWLQYCWKSKQENEFHLRDRIPPRTHDNDVHQVPESKGAREEDAHSSQLEPLLLDSQNSSDRQGDERMQGSRRKTLGKSRDRLNLGQDQVLNHPSSTGDSNSRVPQDRTHVPQDSAHVPQDHAHVPQDRAHVPQDGARVPQDRAHVPQDNAHVPQDRAHVPQDRAQVPQDRAQVPQDRARVPQDRAHVPQDCAHVPQDSAHVSQDSAHVPQDNAHVPQDRAHVPQDRARVPQDRARVPQDRVHVPQDSAHVPQDSAHVPQDSAHVPQDSSKDFNDFNVNVRDKNERGGEDV